MQPSQDSFFSSLEVSTSTYYYYYIPPFLAMNNLTERFNIFLTEPLKAAGKTD